MNKRMRGGGGGNVDVCACTVNGNRESGTKVHSTVNLYVDCVLKKVFIYNMYYQATGTGTRRCTFMCTCAHVPAVYVTV